ncbi:type I-G CRISPR-associated protein Csb2 [Paraburkholderia sp. MM5482-R2]
MSTKPDYLVLEATFLAGTYGGIEWPPSPFKLLQAIVAGCRSVAVAGLDWLEQQSPPLILATDQPELVRFVRFIPNNADPRKPKEATSRREIVHRTVREPVRYCYSLRTGRDREAAKQVIVAASQVHTLGTGHDMCTVRGMVVSDNAPESSSATKLWCPVGEAVYAMRPNAAVMLRAPRPGSLRALEQRFTQFQRRLDTGEAGYGRPVQAPAEHRVVAYQKSDEQSRTALVTLRLVAPANPQVFCRFRPEGAVAVAGMLRHAAKRVAQRWVPELLDFATGYGPKSDLDRRMSWVGLPSVGDLHADGLIRRGLWLGRACDAQQVGELASALPPDGIDLFDEYTNQCAALAVPVAADEEPVLHHYLGRAREWVSVTPVVLPGDYGAGDLRVMTRLIHKAVRESGIDFGLVESVEFSTQGFLRQAVPAWEVKLKDWRAKNLILYHVRLRFRTPIRGPIVLGRGRHFGLGLLCANLN